MKITVEELKEKLKEIPPTKFEYEKVSGEKRKALGTLNENYIPKRHMPKDDSKESSNLKYFDLEKQGWRSLSIDCSTVNVF